MPNLLIKNNPISSELEKKLSKILVIPGNYKKLNDKQLHILKKYIKKKSITLEDVLSMRSAYMNIKLLKNHYKMSKFSSKFTKLYLDDKMPLLDISKKYDFPPIGVLKNIFYKRKFSKEKVKNFFKLKNLNLLDEYDVQQIKLSIDNDIYNKVDQSEQISNSVNFESEIEHFLISKGCKFKTQEMLQEEQIKQYGKAINTPDFLILSDLYINKIKINWIDAKNFYGANTFLIKKKTQKQVNKYIKAYGTGAIFFSLNFSEDLNFENVILVNYNLLT